MKKIITLLLILPLALWCRSEKRLSLELSGSLEALSPTDLNTFSESNRTYIDALTSSYLQQQTPYWQVSNLGGRNDIKSLKRAQSLSGRLRLALGATDRSPALSLGFSYMQGRIETAGSVHFAFDTFYSGRYELERTFDPIQSWVESWTPELGFHLPLIVRTPFRLEAMISAGLVWASCGTFKADLYDKLEESGYHYQTETIKSIEGNGLGAAAQAGLRIDYAPLKGAGLFIEGGYALRRVGNITGEARYKNNLRDNNQDGVGQESAWEGEWLLVNTTTGTYPEVGWQGMNTSNTSEFNLDLSAFFLRVGIRLALF